VRWECKYHVVIIPKYRKRVLYGKVKKHVGEVIREVCRQRGIELLEGHRCVCDRVYQGQECGANPPADSEEQEGDWVAFLEPGILRQHSWIEGRDHKEIHPRTRGP
jgi:hypothetical protein